MNERVVSDALHADNHGGVATSEAVAGLAYYFSGHDFLDIPGLDISPRAFPELTIGAWVKVTWAACDRHFVQCESAHRQPKQEG